MKFFTLCTFVTWIWGQQPQCLLVKLKRSPDLTADNSLHPSWEEKSVRLRLTDEIEDVFIAVQEEAVDKPISECFIPQLKLITERYTYIISLACENLIAFQNEKPYKPSSRQVQSPITFTEDFQYFLEKAVEKYMKIPPKKLYAEYSTSYIPPIQNAVKYEDLDLLLNQLQVVEEDEEEEPDPEVPSESPADWMSEDDLEDTSD